MIEEVHIGPLSRAPLGETCNASRKLLKKVLRRLKTKIALATQ
jgi:hypothetical protein